jgi:predicted lipoprotein with Yx(FWY)xxD motif
MKTTNQKKRLCLTQLIICVLFVLVTNSMHAQWSTDPTVNTPISTAANAQYWQKMVSDGAGGAIITWQDSRMANNNDIYAQRINAEGMIIWTTDGIPICSDTMNQSEPQIISDGFGGAIITWTDFRNDSNYDIYAQRINGDGVVQWQTDGVPIHIGARTQWWPAIVSDGSGGAIIMWDDVDALDSEDIYAQKINAAGVVQWATDGVPICTESAGQEYPAAISDGVGGAIIIWTDERTGGNNIGDIYAQRINNAGVVQWTMNGIPVCTAANPQSNPTLVSDGVNGAIITWDDYRDVNDPDIYAQRITGDGITQWAADGVVITSAINLQSTPVIASDSAGGAIVAWYDYRNGYLNIDIYSQRINASGEVQWTVNGVPLCSAINEQSVQVIVSDGVNGAIVIWEDRRIAIDPNLYAQRIAGDGSTQWTADGILISSATDYQAFPVVISDGAGGAIIAWRDGRNTASFWDIYAQQVNADGNLGVVTGISEESNIIMDFALLQNYPNPFNPSTKFKYSIPTSRFVTLKVYDVLGSEVATLVNEEKPAGNYMIQFNASQLSSGIYFYKLQTDSFIETKKMILMK